MALELVTQPEMVDELAEKTGWSKSDVRSFLAHLGDFTVEAVESGRRVKLPGGVVVGAAVKNATKKRKGRNPATGEEITIAAKPAEAKVKAKVVLPISQANLPSVKALKKRGA